MNTPQPAGGSLLSSWRTPANRLDWIMLGAMGAKWAYDRYQSTKHNNADTTLRFSSDDQPFYWLMRWLEKMPRQKDTACFKVLPPRESEHGIAAPCGSGGSPPRPAQPMLVPTEGVEFQFRGVKCWLEKVEESRNPGSSFAPPQVQLRIRSRDEALILSLLEEITTAAHTKEVPRVYVHQKYYGWTPVRKCPEGRVAVLPDGQRESIIDDVAAFRGSERWYQQAGLPYRRGYLFEGIPGSGKTSLAVDVASEFGMNLCVLAMSGCTDETLAEAVRNMPHNSILLLEDIDCAWTEQREAKEEVTLSGLLNVIDGAATPDGRVTFLTTNHRGKLDPALIRPGRVDFELNFTHATEGQIREITSRFSDRADVDATGWASERLSMAQVQERLVQKYRPKISEK